MFSLVAAFGAERFCMNLFGQQTPNKQQHKSQEARASEKLSSGNGLKIVKRTGKLCYRTATLASKCRICPSEIRSDAVGEQA
jgi:hypothetical protein